MPAPGAPAHVLLAGILAAHRLSLARALSWADNDASARRSLGAALAPHLGRALVVGVTGVPGGGKSTLVSALLGHWLREGLRVAVIAVDPSSPISGGAVLGDRFRMGEHAAHPNCFIRSVSARGQTGAVSRTTRVAIDCFDAAGYDRVVVETVGAGQSETAIAGLADTRIVVCPPGLGDDVQALKAGILEIADLLVVSKGDLAPARDTAQDLRDMLALRAAPTTSVWQPRVVVVSAPRAQGIAELAQAVQAHASIAGRGRRLRAAEPHAEPHAERHAEPHAKPHADPALDRLRALVARDGLCTLLGLSVLAGGPGHAVVAMTVASQHLNFNGVCHGGTIFALADTAFGLAANAHGARASGIDAHLTFQTGVGLGSRLLARAHELSRGRRIGTYRVDVVRCDAGDAETPVSSFTGTVYIQSAVPAAPVSAAGSAPPGAASA